MRIARRNQSHEGEVDFVAVKLPPDVWGKTVTISLRHDFRCSRFGSFGLLLGYRPC